MTTINQVPASLQSTLKALDKSFNGVGYFNIFVDATPVEVLTKIQDLPREQRVDLARDPEVVTQLREFGIAVNVADSDGQSVFVIDKDLERRAFFRLIDFSQPWEQRTSDRFIHAFQQRAKRHPRGEGVIGEENTFLLAMEFLDVDREVKEDARLSQEAASTIDGLAVRAHDIAAAHGFRCYLLGREQVTCTAPSDQRVAQLIQALTKHWGKIPPLALSARTSQELNASARRIANILWAVAIDFTEKHSVVSLGDTQVRAMLAHELGHCIYNVQDMGSVSLVDTNRLAGGDTPISKAHENEYAADKLGVLILYHAGYDPYTFVRLLESNAISYEVSDTHPSMEQRASHAKQYVDRLVGTKDQSHHIPEAR